MLLFVIIGAVMALTSGLVTRGIYDDRTRAIVSISLKAGGCLMVLVSVMLMY